MNWLPQKTMYVAFAVVVFLVFYVDENPVYGVEIMFLLFACIIIAAYIFGEDNGAHPR